MFNTGISRSNTNSYINESLCSSSRSTVSSCRSDRATTSPLVYGQLLTLDSAFYQPTRWKSWYVKKLTCDLSLSRHRRQSLIANETSNNNNNNYIKVNHNNNHYCSYSSRLSREAATVATLDSIRQKQLTRNTTNANTNNKMIKAMHQFSTIKTVYSDDRKSFVADVNPLRAMLVQVDFEVFGEVSGVYFTKYAKSMCENLNIKGWIRVSPRGTVYGQIQGEKEKVDEMALWLRLQGSPGSKIDYCQFKNWQIIDSCDFRNFTIRY
ncbi:hypothetical protein RDWZM_008402 [Blomia tropicalis]|uniref:acylphosphatase n=1 Tax=Blomia tropicalis TaxID=40697 RepID=A0A9Q0M0X6_BLOTA|nr:hypothetical protein RDWZM_008402 [Blomia tropicalis]